MPVGEGTFSVPSQLASFFYINIFFKCRILLIEEKTLPLWQIII